MRTFLCILIVSFWAANASAAPGSEVFIKNSCAHCHSVEAKGVKWVGGRKAPAGDLSNIGTKHTVDELTKYIKGELKFNDKKHFKPWRGKAEDAATIAEWLVKSK